LAKVTKVYRVRPHGCLVLRAEEPAGDAADVDLEGRQDALVLTYQLVGAQAAVRADGI